MKIVNMVKLKEEYDYESLCRKLETQVDQLIAEIERQQKIQENDKNELEKQLRGYCNSFDEEKKNLVTQVEDLTAEIEKQQKLRENDKYEFEKQLREYQDSYDEARKHLASRCEVAFSPHTLFCSYESNIFLTQAFAQFLKISPHYFQVIYFGISLLFECLFKMISFHLYPLVLISYWRRKMLN